MKDSNSAYQSTKGFNCIFIHSAVDDLGLTPYEFRVFAHVARRSSSGMCWSSHAAMSAICRMHEDTIKASLKRLEEIGVLQVEPRQGQTTVYRIINQPEQWKRQINGTPPAVDPPDSNHRVTIPPHPPVTVQGDPPAVDPPKGNPIRKSKKKGIATTVAGQADHPGNNEFNDAWMEAWAKRTNGSKYKYTSKSDGPASAQIVKLGVPIKTLIETAKWAWQFIGDTDRNRFHLQNSATIAGFTSSWNQIYMQKLREGQPPPVAQRQLGSFLDPSKQRRPVEPGSGNY